MTCFQPQHWFLGSARVVKTAKPGLSEKGSVVERGPSSLWKCLFPKEHKGAQEPCSVESEKTNTD